jgi:hypothetical protein
LQGSTIAPRSVDLPTGVSTAKLEGNPASSFSENLLSWFLSVRRTRFERESLRQFCDQARGIVSDAPLDWQQVRCRARLGEAVQARSLHRGKPDQAAEVDQAADQAADAPNDPGRFQAVQGFEDGAPAQAGLFLDCLHARAAKPIRAAHEAEDQAAEHLQPGLPKDATASADGLCAALERFSGDDDAGTFVAIKRPAVLARVGNKPGAAAKVVSHGDLLPSMSSEAESRQAASVLGNGLQFEGESDQKSVADDLLFPVLPGSKPASERVFAFKGYAGLRLDLTPLARFTRFCTFGPQDAQHFELK